jgi:hypothetical protein
MLNRVDAQTPPIPNNPDLASRWYTSNGSISRWDEQVSDWTSFPSREDSSEGCSILFDLKNHVEMTILDRSYVEVFVRLIVL